MFSRLGYLELHGTSSVRFLRRCHDEILRHAQLSVPLLSSSEAHCRKTAHKTQRLTKRGGAAGECSCALFPLRLIRVVAAGTSGNLKISGFTGANAEAPTTVCSGSCCKRLTAFGPASAHTCAVAAGRASYMFPQPHPPHECSAVARTNEQRHFRMRV